MSYRLDVVGGVVMVLVRLIEEGFIVGHVIGPF